LRRRSDVRRGARGITVPETVPVTELTGLIELPCGRGEIAGTHNVVPLEHRARLVARHRHRDALGDARADEVADRCSAEVMRNATRAARQPARRDPPLAKTPDRLLFLLLAILARADEAHEHPRHDVAGLLQPLPFSLLGLEQLAQLHRQREDAAFVNLRRARIERDRAGLQIDLAPFEADDFAASPTRQVHERDERLHVRWQASADRLELLALEEPRPDVVLAQHRDVRFVQQIPAFDRQREHTLQRRKLAVDLDVRDLAHLLGIALPGLDRVGLTFGDVRADVAG
jgi:hypothetical protein